MATDPKMAPEIATVSRRYWLLGGLVGRSTWADSMTGTEPDTTRY